MDRSLWTAAIDAAMEAANRAERALSARRPAVARRCLSESYGHAMDALNYAALTSDVADARDALDRIYRLSRAADRLI